MNRQDRGEPDPRLLNNEKPCYFSLCYFDAVCCNRRVNTAKTCKEATPATENWNAVCSVSSQTSLHFDAIIVVKKKKSCRLVCDN